MPSALVLKLFLVPACIGLVSLAVRRWGPTVGGWLAGLPVVVGPILFLLWLQQGPEFARGATLYSLASVLPAIVFAGSYAWSSRRCRWPGAAAIAYGMWILVAGTMLLMPMDVVSSTLLAAGSLLLAPYAFPRANSAPTPVPPARFDTGLRMLAGFALTVLVTSMPTAGDTRISGVLSMFPVLSSILAVSIHRVAGSGAVIEVLRGLAGGLWSLVAFCATLLTVPSEHPAQAFGTAILVAIGIQALVARRRGLLARREPFG